MVGRFTKDAHLTRKNRGRNKVPRNRPHLFAEARHFPRRDGERRLGGHVASRRTRTARRENEVAADDVDEFAKRLLDVEAFVGDEALVNREGILHGLSHPGFERGNAFVAIDASARAVGDRDEPENQFVFRFAGRFHAGVLICDQAFSSSSSSSRKSSSGFSSIAWRKR